MNWRDEIANLVACYDKIYFYTADPGATAILRVIYEQASAQNKAQSWFVEGWAAHAYLPNACSIENETRIFSDDICAENTTLIMGQQVNFERAYERLKYFRSLEIETIFISDHWKSIERSFKPDETTKVILPHHFYVPDQIAYDVQMQNLTAHGISENELKRVMEVFIHPGVEYSLEQVKSFSTKELKTKYNTSGETIVMMLDCIQDSEKERLGFDWKCALAQAVKHFQSSYPSNASLLVKPHPRQEPEIIQAHLKKYKSDKRIKMVTEPIGEPFVAMADEVWGITTILLIVALKAGKPIKVFMPNRTVLGKKESNAHIEPYVMAIE